MIYGFTVFLSRFLNYLLLPLYTRVMEPAEYGKVTLFYSIMAFGIVLATFSTDTYYFRKASSPPNNISLIFSNLIMMNFMASMISFVLCLVPVLIFQKQFSFFDIFCFFSILVMDGFSVVPLSYLRHQSKVLTYSITRLLSVIVNILLNLVFFVMMKKNSASWVFLANLGGSSAGSFLLLILTKSLLNARSISVPLLKEIIVYCTPLTISSFAGMINENIDRVLIGILEPGDEIHRQMAVGIYGASYKLGTLIYLFVGVFRLAFDPRLFQMVTNNLVVEFRRLTCLSIFLTGLSVLAIVFFIDYIKLIIAAEYHEGIKIVPFVAFSYLLYSALYFNSFWYKTVKGTFWSVVIIGAGAFITILFNFTLIPGYGYIAAAWTTLLSYITMTMLSFLLGYKNFKIFPYKSVNTLLITNAFLIIAGIYMHERYNIPYLQAGILAIAFYSVVYLFTEYTLRKNSVSN